MCLHMKKFTCVYPRYAYVVVGIQSEDEEIQVIAGERFCSCV